MELLWLSSAHGCVPSIYDENNLFLGWAHRPSTELDGAPNFRLIRRAVSNRVQTWSHELMFIFSLFLHMHTREKKSEKIAGREIKKTSTVFKFS